MKTCKYLYQSFLLRLWRVMPGESWRAMVECVDTHQRHSFGSLEDLLIFLKNQTAEHSEDD